jgi:2,4-dienoyl-CoA reductase-like NADH-dependent reductase (Old Yellow Enzyme family)
LNSPVADIRLFTVARFFKYHSVSDLTAENERLGIDLRFSDDLSPLFRPVKVGARRVGNSLCIQPMEGCDGQRDGKPDELTYRRYRRFGAGGAKLIWGEAAAVVEEGRATPRQLWVCENNFPEFAQIVRECRAAHRESCGDDSDLLIGLQLTHSGRYSHPQPLIACRDPLLDPRTKNARFLDDEYLSQLVGHYVSAAKLAREAGFDFVDVKQCHRYLLNEMLSAKNRSGKYGGDSSNRTRLPRDIIRAIRSEVPDLIVTVRLGVFDGIPYRNAADNIGEPCPWVPPVQTAFGTCETDPLQPDLSEPLQWIAEMRSLGVELLNVSMGNPYASPHIIRPFEYPPPDGYESPEHPLIGVDRHFRLTAEIQQRFPDLPVVGSGYSYLQEFIPQAGAANIRDGRVTFVGIGRASLAQPDFARQLQEHGKLERVRVCRTFSYCTALMRSKHNELGQFATGCPPFDKEVYGAIWQEALKTKGDSNAK